MKKTACPRVGVGIVSKSIRLLLITLIPLLSLVWVTQLLAQATSTTEIVLPLPDFIITNPTLTTIEDGDKLQIRFVGLNQDVEGNFLPVSRLDVEPNERDAGIYLISSRIRPLSDDPFYITLLIDTSGSMDGNLPDVKTQLTYLINQSPANAYFSLIGFNGQIQTEQFTAFINDKETLLRQVTRLNSEDGSTCLDDVVYTAVQSLAQLPQDTRRAIILFTDGVDEITQGQPERCSQQFRYEDAVNLASTQTVPIPLHTVIFPYPDKEETGGPLESQNKLLTGLTINANNIPKSFRTFSTIIDSFTQQWEATIDLYTLGGEHTLNLTPRLPNGTTLATQPLTYTTQFDYFPAALPKDVQIKSVNYNEKSRQFEIEIILCASGKVYCNPANTSGIDLLIEDVFTRKLTPRTLRPDEFTLSGMPQIITAPIRLQPEHYYLMRVTAKNGITPANYHPYGEAIFVYRPRLDIQVTQAKLDRFALQPDLIISLLATRTVSTEPITAVAELMINGRQIFTETAVSPPTRLTLSGYLLYTGEDNQKELYELPRQVTTTTNLATTPITLTFPAAAGGGYADYKLLLTAIDRQDDFTTQYELEKVQPDSWWGNQLQQVRQILANPLIFVVAIFLFLLLLSLIWLAAWTARRMIQPEETPPQKEPEPESQPAHLRVDASPDYTVRHQTFLLPQIDASTFLIGTRQECDLTMRDDQLMAEEHAKIKWVKDDSDGRYYLINCDPDYSTFINQNEIISGVPIPINDGDKIRLGALTRLTLHNSEKKSEMNTD